MKIRVILNGIHFYTTRAAIKKGKVGDSTMQNSALMYALDLMEDHDGIGTTVRLYDHKMVQHKFDIQLNKVL
jgi:hypothetical protein